MARFSDNSSFDKSVVDTAIGGGLLPEAKLNSGDNVSPKSTSSSSTKFDRSATALRMRAGEWHADLDLEIKQSSNGARLTRYHRNGPLHVQKAFYPEGPNLAHLYLLHPPGGLVSGDSLIVRANVAEASAALVTTPGAGRFYGARANSAQQVQNNFLVIGPQASLEWFPMETLFYSGSNGRSHTEIKVAEGGKFIGWDIATLGLPASNQPFIAGQLRQSLEIHYAGQLTWLERWRFNAQDAHFLNSPAGLAGQSSNGILLAGPFKLTVAENTLNKLHQICERIKHKEHGFAGVTQVNQWLAVRYVGPSATHARELFTQAWLELRPLLIKRNACPPRIWAC